MAENGITEQPEAGQPSGRSGISTKWWLIIGGGAGGGVLLIIIVAVVLLFVTGVIGGGLPQPSSSLDLVPEDAYRVVTADVQKILDSDYLADEFDLDDVDEIDDLGLHPNDLSEMVFAASQDGDIIVFKGDFNLGDIRDEFEDQDGEQETYRGYEVWEDLYGGGAAALLDGYILASDSVRAVENTLKNLYNGDGSLARAGESNEMKRILGKLGRGFVVQAAGERMCAVGRCEGYGYAVTEVDDSAAEAKIEIAFLFGNERTAERAADDYDEIADFLEYEEDIDIEDTKAEGRFVVGIAFQELN